MAILITAVGKINPSQPAEPMLYYPRAVQSGVVDLDKLTEQISNSTTLTETDCHAVIISLVNTVSKALDDGKIVRLGQLGTFQVSVKGTASATPEEISGKNISSASIVFRPGTRFKKMLTHLTFARKK
jgi:predicted histone-like DNA-binding protein